MLNIFKKKISPNSSEAFYAHAKKRPLSRIKVLKTIASIEPCHYRQVSRKLRTIEGSVTPRIAELRHKGLIKVAFVSVGVSRTRVNYYKITRAGQRELIKFSEIL